MDDNYVYPSTELIGTKLPNNSTFTGKLVITTCFYQAQAHSRYTQSLVATVAVLERLGIAWDFWPVHGDFHVERAVNNMLAQFMESDATDILIIDSDESWDVMAVLRLIAHPEEIVGCAYRMKNRWETYTCRLKGEDGVPVGKMLKDGTALLEADRAPGGFLRIRKSALMKFVQKFPDEYYWGGPNADKKVPFFFRTGIIDNVFFSQDYYFSERMKEAGVRLWIDPNGVVNHYGTTEYEGNLDAWLRDAVKKADSEEKDLAAFETVKAMAA